MKGRTLPVLVLATVFLPAFSTEGLSQEARQNDFMVIGRVVYGPKRVPLEGIEMSLSRPEDGAARGPVREDELTDEKGEFRLSGLGYGDWEVNAWIYGGGIRFSRDLVINAPKAGPVEIHVPERTVVHVSGWIRDEKGESLPDVRVVMKVKNRPGPPVERTTDSNGNFLIEALVIELPKPRSRKGIPFGVHFDDYPFLDFDFQHARYPDHYCLEFLDRLPRDELRVEYSMYPKCRVRGAVVDEAGKPLHIGGAFFTRFYSGTGWSGGSRWADANGEFEIEEKEKGRLVMGGCIFKEYWLERKIVQVMTGKETEEVRLVARKVRMHWISLKDLEGKPLLRHDVKIEADIQTDVDRLFRPTLEDRYPGHETLYEDVAEFDGCGIALPLFFEKKAKLILSGEGFVGQTVLVDSEEPTSKIEIEVLPPVLMGEIRLPEGASSGSLKLTLSAGEEYPYGARTWNPFRCADGGRLTFRLLAFSNVPKSVPYSVTFLLTGYSPWVKRRIFLGNSQDPVVVEFRKE